MHLHRLLLGLVLLAPPAARALEFRVLSFNGEISGLKLREGKTTLDISANDDVLSGVYNHDAPGPLELFREIPGADVTTKETVALLQPPDAAITRAILVLAAIPGGGCTGHWIDDMPENNPVNTLSVHNFSGRPLALRIGNEQWQQAGGQLRRLAFATTQKQLPLLVAARAGNTWSTLLATPIPVRKNYRIHLILRPPTPLESEQNILLGSVLIPDYAAPAKIN
ncbi:MAG TPA: hypothetical protein VIO38_12150 [Rariglobus sp.]